MSILQALAIHIVYTHTTKRQSRPHYVDSLSARSLFLGNCKVLVFASFRVILLELELEVFVAELFLVEGSVNYRAGFCFDFDEFFL
jgi:hypothetical protein